MSEQTNGERGRSFQVQEVSGVKIRNLNYVFIIVLAALSIVLSIVTTKLSVQYASVTEITDEYLRIEQDAKMVLAASDDLTRDVQYFVMTGRKEYMDSYFREAKETRRRENAIADLKEMEATDTLFNLLESSVKESMNLMRLEYKAMRYASEGRGLDLSDLPDEVKDTVLPEEASSMTDEEKITRSWEIIFGEDYKRYKDRIYGYESQYLEKAIALMDDLLTEGRAGMNRLLILQRTSIFLIVILGVILFVSISRMIVRPLRNAVTKISDGQRITPLNGTYEIKYMSETYNGFYNDSMEIQKQLKQKAERDGLTGALNRNGFQTVIDQLSQESYPLALLIIDVDSFKGVNDHYGHPAGDETLKKITRLLMESFRTTDIVSRIGGDEFTVIMSGLTPEYKNVIEDKVREINEALRIPGPGSCPKVSISVGCAFSSSGYKDSVFSEADEKLYEVKKAGGCDVRFA